MQLFWSKLLSSSRFSDDLRPVTDDRPEIPDWIVSSRTEIERDYDRILFSTPLRRLRDKTQVFPLEKHDSVRNRLTHSHEVANLARSVGTYIAHSNLGKRIATDLGSELASEGKSNGDAEDAARRAVVREIPAMLSAVALAHDLGNPPFGHQGEETIRDWMRANAGYFDGSGEIESTKLDSALQQDFLGFEGNAQTIRVVTRLQVVRDDLGLNLTYGTLAALLKYTRGSGSSEIKGNASTSKIGFFASEEPPVRKIWEVTGLGEGIRHPLTFIMEACDDVAYSVLDAEDAVKKQIVSFADLIAKLQAAASDPVSDWVINRSLADHETLRQAELSPLEMNDVSMQKFRVHAINALMSQVIRAFEQEYPVIMRGEFVGSLIKKSGAKPLVSTLKDFDRLYAYRNRQVRAIELLGYNTLQELMTLLWRGICLREKQEDVGSKRTNPFSAYAYECISDNYRRIFEGRLLRLRRDDPSLPVRYRELQLLTDMVSGMTDNFALELLKELKGYYVGPSAH